MSEGLTNLENSLDLDDFQHAFMSRYIDLAEVLDKKALLCQDILRFLEPFVENERIYAQNIDKIIQQRMPVQLIGEEPGLFNVWSIFKQWGSTLKSNASESHKEFRAAKEELERCYASFDQERKKYSAFLSAKQKEFSSNVRKLTKARDKYFKRCQSELSQPDPDTKQMSIDKETYKSQLVIANNALKLFYSFDLPKYLKAAETALITRIESVQNCIRRIVTMNKNSCERLSGCDVNVLDAINSASNSKGDVTELTKKYNTENTQFQTIPQFTYQEYSSSAILNAATIHENNATDELVLGRPQPRSDPNLVKILFDSESQATPRKLSGSSSMLLSPRSRFNNPISNSSKEQAVQPPKKPVDECNNKKVEEKSTKVLGVSLDELMRRQSGSGGDERIPLITKYFVECLLRLKVESVPNIFKRGGKAVAVKEFKENVDNGVLDYNVDPYVCADVFKFWIRSLPEPLIPNSLYDEAIKCCNDVESGELYKKLPEPNKSILEYLLHFLCYLSKHSSVTNMNESSLANMFSSCIMKCNCTDMKEMIAAAEKQSAFMLGLFDAVSSGIIPGTLFGKSIENASRQLPDIRISNENYDNSSVVIITGGSPLKDKEENVNSESKNESESAKEGFFSESPSSSLPPPLRPVNASDNGNKGVNGAVGSPRGTRWIPPHPKKPPPLPPAFEKLQK